MGLTSYRVKRPACVSSICWHAGIGRLHIIEPVYHKHMQAPDVPKPGSQNEKDVVYSDYIIDVRLTRVTSHAFASAGVTGVHVTMESRAEGLIEMIHDVTDKSVAVGFGISSPEAVSHLCI